MIIEDFDAEAFVRQNAALIGLSLTPEQMTGVVANISRILPMAQSFLDFPMDDTVEIASVFEP